MKNIRKFLETDADSYIKVDIGKASYDKDEVTVKLADCNRSITWYFGPPGNKKAIAKITVIKNIVDKIYNHLTMNGAA